LFVIFFLEAERERNEEERKEEKNPKTFPHPHPFITTAFSDLHTCLILIAANKRTSLFGPRTRIGRRGERRGGRRRRRRKKKKEEGRRKKKERTKKKHSLSLSFVERRKKKKTIALSLFIFARLFSFSPLGNSMESKVAQVCVSLVCPLLESTPPAIRKSS